MTATEAYESITKGGTSDFALAAAALDRNPPWCLIGGLAINTCVEPFHTLDADVVVLARNLDAIATQLREDDFVVRQFPHSPNAQRGSGRLNIRFTTDARYQPFVQNASRAMILGMSVPVASLEDLIRGKVWAWRDAERRLSKRKKDELDLIRIAEVYPKLRALIPDEITSQFEKGTSET